MRRVLDQYFTPATLVHALADYVPVMGNILEPCAGDGRMAQAITGRWQRLYGVFHSNTVLTNDIDQSLAADFHEDATNPNSEIWRSPQPDWVITNPPFNVAMPILENAYTHAIKGVAFLLRLTFLEPTAMRRAWLKKYAAQMSDLIIFGSPRPSFTDNGRTDSVTVAWMVWRKNWPLYETQITFATLDGGVGEWERGEER